MNKKELISKYDTKHIKEIYYRFFLTTLSSKFYQTKLENKIMKSLEDFLKDDIYIDNFCIDKVLYNIYFHKIYIKYLDKIIKKYKNTDIYKYTKKKIKHDENVSKRR